MKLWIKSFLKALAAISGNLSAGWFALAIITPNFAYVFSVKTLTVLTLDIAFGIVFLAITTVLERKLKNE